MGLIFNKHQDARWALSARKDPIGVGVDALHRRPENNSALIMTAFSIDWAETLAT